MKDKIASTERKISRIKCIAIILAALGVLAFFIPFFYCHASKMKLNELGDYIGGVSGSIWALSAIFFVYVAFLGQQLQIYHQALEILDSKIENDQIRFETTFFSLLNSHNDVVKQLDFRKRDGQVISGAKDVFRTYYKHFKQRVDSEKKSAFKDESMVGGGFDFHNMNFDTVELPRERMVRCFQEKYRKVEGDLGHYFRSLFNVLEFVDAAPSAIEKDRYFETVLRQLSVYETVFLYYFGQLPFSTDYKKFIERHGLLRYLNVSYLLDGHNMKDAYLSSALSPK